MRGMPLAAPSILRWVCCQECCSAAAAHPGPAGASQRRGDPSSAALPCGTTSVVCRLGLARVSARSRCCGAGGWGSCSAPRPGAAWWDARGQSPSGWWKWSLVPGLTRCQGFGPGLYCDVSNKRRVHLAAQGCGGGSASRAAAAPVAALHWRSPGRNPISGRALIQLPGCTANPASRSEHYPLPEGGVSGPCGHSLCLEHFAISPCLCESCAAAEEVGEAHGSVCSSPAFAQAVCSENFCSSVWSGRRERCRTDPPQCCTRSPGLL